MIRLLAVAVTALALSGCAGLQGPGSPSRTESDIISTPLVQPTCLGAVRGTPTFSGPDTHSFVYAYTRAQVAVTGRNSSGFTPVMYWENQPG